MALVIPCGFKESWELIRECFTVVVSETTGKSTLIIPRIAVELSGEGHADSLVNWILRDIDMAEGLGA